MVTIRKARRSDFNSIHEVETLAFGDSAFSKRAMSYHIANNLVLCAEIDGLVIGYICFSPLTKTRKRRIYSIAVHASYRKHGVAKTLMLEGEVKSRAKTIILEVDETNIPAIRLYEKLGYTVFGRYHLYYGKTDALRMKKSI